jgi:phospholipid/cholesterol/gamma-HCH transport system substrate-binding protein
MNKDRNALKAGTFIVIASVLTLAITIAIKDFGRFAESAQVRTVRFKLSDDLGGLRVGDEVRVGGFKVGTIQSIEPVDFGGKEEAVMEVRFSLPTKYVLREGTTVGVQSTLTGSSSLNVLSLGQGNPADASVALVGVSDPKTRALNSLGDTKFAETVSAFKQTADTATETIGKARDKIDPAYEKYATIADRAGEAVTGVRDVVRDGKPQIDKTLSNLTDATGTVKDKLPGAMEQVKTLLAKVETSVDRVQGTLTDLNATMANLKDASGGARSVIVANRSKIDAVFASIKATGDNLKAASSEIRRSPWRLLYKPGKGEMANLNLYDAARQFAEGANDMNDAATALRDAIQSKDVDGKQLQALVDKLDESFSSFQKVEKVLWEKVQE